MKDALSVIICVVPFISEQPELLARYVGWRRNIPRAANISTLGGVARIFVDTEATEKVRLLDLLGGNVAALGLESINCVADKSRMVSPLLKENLNRDYSRVGTYGGESTHVEGIRIEHANQQGATIEQTCSVRSQPLDLMLDSGEKLSTVSAYPDVVSREDLVNVEQVDLGVECVQPLFPRLQRIKARIQVVDSCAQGSSDVQNLTVLPAPPNEVVCGSGPNLELLCSSGEYPNRDADGSRGFASKAAGHVMLRETERNSGAGSVDGSLRRTGVVSDNGPITDLAQQPMEDLLNT